MIVKIIALIRSPLHAFNYTLSKQCRCVLLKGIYAPPLYSATAFTSRTASYTIVSMFSSLIKFCDLPINSKYPTAAIVVLVSYA